MQKLLITLLLLLFVSEVYPAFANSESVSKEIEKVEIKKRYENHILQEREEGVLF